MKTNDVILTLLFWQFWTFNNPFGKNLIRIFLLNYLCDSSQERYSNTLPIYFSWKTTIMYLAWQPLPNTPIFHESILKAILNPGIFYLFWAGLVQKTSIVRVGYNLVNKLIGIRCIRWFTFTVLDRECFFFGKSSPKNQNCRLNLTSFLNYPNNTKC